MKEKTKKRRGGGGEEVRRRYGCGVLCCVVYSFVCFFSYIVVFRGELQLLDS